MAAQRGHRPALRGRLGRGDRGGHLVVGGLQRGVRTFLRLGDHFVLVRRQRGRRLGLRRRGRELEAAGELASHRTQALERLAELARQDPHLVGVTLRDLRQHLQVLVRQQRLVGLTLVDRAEHGRDRLRLTLGLEDLRLALGLRAQDLRLARALRLEDRRLLLTLRREDRRLPDTLGGQHRGALVTVGAHLLLHRVLDRRRRVDALDLDAVDLHAPLAGRLVEDRGELGVDLFTTRQRTLEVHATDDVPQRGHRELLDGLDVVGDLVRRAHRVGHLEVDDGVDRDHQVVLGDHRLRRERDDLLAEVQRVTDLVDERHEDRQAGMQRTRVPPEPLHDARASLRDDADGSGDHDDDEQRYDDCNNRWCHGSSV